MKLDKALCLGIQEINEQHEALLQRLSTLEDAFKSGRGWQETHYAIVDLSGLTRKHFGFEEALMRMYAYPGLKEHQHDHNDILNKLEKLEHRSLTETTEQEALALLQDYFMRHMLQLDQDYAEYILHGAQVVRAEPQISLVE